LGPHQSEGPKAFRGSDPRIWACGHMAVAPTGPILSPSLQRVRSGPNILRRVEQQIERKERNVSGSVGGEASR